MDQQARSALRGSFAQAGLPRTTIGPHKGAVAGADELFSLPSRIGIRRRAVGRGAGARHGRNEPRRPAHTDVWQSEVVPQLVADTDGRLQVLTLSKALCRRHPGAFGRGSSGPAAAGSRVAGAVRSRPRGVLQAGSGPGLPSCVACLYGFPSFSGAAARELVERLRSGTGAAERGPGAQVRRGPAVAREPPCRPGRRSSGSDALVDAERTAPAGRTSAFSPLCPERSASCASDGTADRPVWLNFRAGFASRVHARIPYSVSPFFEIVSSLTGYRPRECPGGC